MIRDTLDTLANTFPEWKEQLSKSTPNREWEYVVTSPNKMTKLVFSISDRLNVKFEKINLEFFHASEAISVLKEITSETLVYVEYVLDRNLAESLEQDVPIGIPEHQGSTLLVQSKIPTKNSEWAFANRIRTISWSGSFNKNFEAIYGK